MQDTLYAIVITQTKEILDPESFKKYWKNYGSNWLCGWRKPKKVYLKLGQAKCGFAHIPEEMKPHLSIAEFTFKDFIIDGGQIQEEQKNRKDAERQRRNEKLAKYRLRIAEDNLKKSTS